MKISKQTRLTLDFIIGIGLGLSAYQFVLAPIFHLADLSALDIIILVVLTILFNRIVARDITARSSKAQK